MPLFADHSICFPIPNTVAQVNYFRAFLNGYFILDLATPLDAAIALASLLLTSQVGVKVATTSLIGIDILVNPRRADAWLIIIFKVTLICSGLQSSRIIFSIPVPVQIASRMWMRGICDCLAQARRCACFGR